MNNKEELINQLKFYFSHANYIKDIFLKTECEKKINEEFRGIPISTILIFSKLKAIKATEEDIINCIKSNELKDIIKLRIDSENKNYLLKNDIKDFEIYKEKVSKDPDSFILRLNGINGELKDIKLYLSQYFNPLLIRLRKDKKTKKATGTCFVELGTQKEIEEVLEMKIPIMINGKENNDPKRIKIETEFIEIIKKKDYINKTKLTPEEKQREILLQKNKGKFYKFESNLINLSSKNEEENERKKEMQNIIQLIKKKIGAQFIDLKEKILRFKDIQNFEEKEIEGIKLKKLTCEEEKEYINNIPVKVYQKK